MTSSPPPPFDDGGELPETTIILGDDTDRRDAGEDGRDAGSEPNYLIRRAIVMVVVVAVIAALAVVVGRIIGADGEDDGAPPVVAEWNSIVVVADDEIRLVDPSSGEVTTTYPAEEALLDAESLTTGRTLVLMNDFGRITELDLADGTIRRSSAPDGSVLTLSGQNASIVLAGPPLGGDIAVVDTGADERVKFDIGVVADLTDPLMFVDQVLVNESGSHVATADARSFQSVLVDVATETPILLAGQVVALDDDTIVTAQRAGERAELEFYDLAGERRGSADGPAPQVTVLTAESTALIVSTDGTISAVSAGGSVDEIGRVGPVVAGGTAPVEVLGGVAALGSTRVLVSTSDETVLVDVDGTVLRRAAGELLAPVRRESTCAIVGVPRPTGRAAHVDLDTGLVLGEVAGGIVASASADGCTLAIIGDVPRIVDRGVELDLDASAGSVTIAPDGSAFVLTTASGERLVPIRRGDDGDDGDEPPEPVVLATEPVLIRFAEI